LLWPAVKQGSLDEECHRHEKKQRYGVYQAPERPYLVDQNGSDVR
ncbi:MAG: hypothetical protein QOE61_3303, partial [Micromonosporaceae bacterium]|nr:hypothetical protein [Micromonosporaceae bacterium]